MERDGQSFIASLRPQDYVAIPCNLGRGGFSSERTCTFESGGRRYQEVVSFRYCFDSSGQPIPEIPEPPRGAIASGKVVGQFLGQQKDYAIVEIQNGERVQVLPQDLQKPPEGEIPHSLPPD